MIHSLFARLSVALLVLMAAISGGFLAIEQWSAGQYYEELTRSKDDWKKLMPYTAQERARTQGFPVRHRA